MKKPEYLIVTGTSAGGLKALMELAAPLHRDMDAAVMVVMHLSKATISDFLLLKLQPITVFKCMVAVDGMPIEAGCLYIAPPNAHLLADDNNIRLGYGPEENRWKPSIDVLFRSAAAHWGNKVVGIILTGLLDDGTVGMLAIKKSGGTCIVQDPNKAEYPDMPLSVLNATEVQYCVPVAEIGGKILATITAVKSEKLPAPQEVLIEAEIASKVVIGYTNIEKLGAKSNFACPDCGGGLVQIKEPKMEDRYRCHIGHAYTETELALRQNEILESTLWVALRIMEEKKTLLQKMEKNNLGKGFKMGAAVYEEKAAGLQQYIENLKSILFNISTNKT